MSSYECGFCGKKYDSIKARMICESNCSSNKERAEELASARKELNDLRNRESKLVSELQTTRDNVKKAEKKVSGILHGCNTQCKKDSTTKNVYEVNGETVSKDEFFNQLDNLFGNLF